MKAKERNADLARKMEAQRVAASAQMEAIKAGIAAPRPPSSVVPVVVSHFASVAPYAP